MKENITIPRELFDRMSVACYALYDEGYDHDEWVKKLLEDIRMKKER